MKTIIKCQLSECKKFKEIIDEFDIFVVIQLLGLDQSDELKPTLIRSYHEPPKSQIINDKNNFYKLSGTYTGPYLSIDYHNDLQTLTEHNIFKNDNYLNHKTFQLRLSKRRWSDKYYVRVNFMFPSSLQLD